MSQASHSNPLKICLLGSFEISLEGNPLPRPRAQAGQWLLALLALRQGHPVERAWLAGVFWPDSSHEQALFNLRRNLTDLRRVLGSEAYRLEAPTPRTLQFNLVGAECDVAAFDAAIKRNDKSSLEEAVRLYRGALLEECVEEWIIAEREARSHAYLGALETLAARAMDEGKPMDAVGCLRRVLAADNYRETALRMLLSALSAAGDLTAATLAYREYRLLLARDLRMEPDPETQQLFRSLQRTKRSTASSEMPAVTQAALPPARFCVPCPVTELVGRVREMQTVCEYLLRARLVTLTGAGGIGKTRLALAVAEKLNGQFEEGIWFVDLAPISDGLLVPQAIAGCLGLREEADTLLMRSLPQFLASKSLLLILDNCEHLREECARIVRVLLSECAGLRILTTSRQALGLTGENVWQVPCLALPDDSDGWHKQSQGTPLDLEAIQCDAIQLFVERAREASSVFALTAQNRDVIVSICRRLDGIALAIELAAARVRVMPVEQIARRLDDRFRLLTAGSAATFPRQQTLRATLDWSYQLLEAQEQRLLCRLSVFVGGWTLEMAEAVCSDNEEEESIQNDNAQCTLPKSFSRIDPSDVLYLLMALVDKSLVVFDEQADPPRYRLLETVRQYALERLRERGQEEETLQRRCVGYFVRFAEKAELYLSGSEEQAYWFECVDQERDNLRAALDVCRSKPESVEDGLRIGAALRWYWDAHGLSQEAGQNLMTLLSMAGEKKRTAAHAKAMFVAAWLLDTISAASATERTATYLPRLEEVLAIYQELDDRQGIAFLWQEIGYQYLTRQDYEMARRYLEQSLNLWREIGDRKASAAALMGLGMAANQQNDHSLARIHYEEAAAIDREYRQRGGWAQANLCCILIEMGEFANAEILAHEDLSNAWELDNKPKILFVLEVFMSLAERQKQDARAVRLCAAHHAAYRSIYRQNPSLHPGVERLRAEMQDDAFAAAWAEGDAMTLEQAVHDALSHGV
jgi:predicted ATPase/DNA-binding SARP family transcriptional activator